PPAVCPLSLHDALPISDPGDDREPSQRAGVARHAAQPLHRERSQAGGVYGRLARPNRAGAVTGARGRATPPPPAGEPARSPGSRSEEHTSELQSPCNLV